MSPQFPFTWLDECGHHVIKIEVSNIVVTDATLKALANQLMEAARSSGDGHSTTVWVSVVAKQLPDYLVRAIESFAGFGIGLIVTHGERCSHEPGAPLPDVVVSAIQNVNRSGRVWHPLAGKLVFSEL